jgi:hypothetical protein
MRALQIEWEPSRPAQIIQAWIPCFSDEATRCVS